MLIDAVRGERYDGQITHEDIRGLTFAACNRDPDEAFHDNVDVIWRLYKLRASANVRRCVYFALLKYFGKETYLL